MGLEYRPHSSIELDTIKLINTIDFHRSCQKGFIKLFSICPIFKKTENLIKYRYSLAYTLIPLSNTAPNVRIECMLMTLQFFIYKIFQL